jgi:hypothetical protein
MLLAQPFYGRRFSLNQHFKAALKDIEYRPTPPEAA